MKAVVLTEYGDTNRLQLRDVPEPTPGPNEIAVRVTAAGINPVDWKLRSGALRGFMPLELPAILGRDVSGHVVAVGPGVTAFRVGAPVLGLVRGGYAQVVVAPVDAWAEVPDGLDLVEAAALPLVALTGAQLIEEAVRLQGGETLLITGAVGGVGRSAVFVARERGARILAGVRARQRPEATKLGAAGVIALDDPSGLADVPELDAIADTVGGETTEKLILRLKSGGRVGSVVGEPRGAKERGLTVRTMLTHPDPKRLAELARAAAEGKLVIPIAKRLPLERAGEAHKLAESGAGGKVVLTV
jgi:NADPH:quinone reductase-like Zn-dependent oxidoreductase